MFPWCVKNRFKSASGYFALCRLGKFCQELKFADLDLKLENPRTLSSAKSAHCEQCENPRTLSSAKSAHYYKCVTCLLEPPHTLTELQAVAADSRVKRIPTDEAVKERARTLYTICEGDGDVVGVVTHLVRGGAQVLHGDQIVGLSVLLEVHEKEEEGEDGEGQIEVESERGELKERRTCTWMT